MFLISLQYYTELDIETQEKFFVESISEETIGGNEICVFTGSFLKPSELAKDNSVKYEMLSHAIEFVEESGF